MFMASISKTEGQLGKSGIGIILAVLVVIVIGVVYFATKGVETAEAPANENVMDEETKAMMSESAPPRDASKEEVDDDVRAMIPTLLFDMQGELEDVSGGDATGVVKATFKDGVYYMHAEMDRLPDPETFGEGYFYEGWIVRTENLHVLSTGVVDVDITGHGENTYTSKQNWSDHDFFVLTIEPDDGDPAPADHILEGRMMSN